MKDGNFAGNTGPSPSLDETALKELMKDPRYWEAKSRDPNYIKQIDDGWQRLHRS